MLNFFPCQFFLTYLTDNLAYPLEVRSLLLLSDPVLVILQDVVYKDPHPPNKHL